MDREHEKGAADKPKGSINETAGKIIGDKKLAAEAKADEARGDLHKAASDVKDTARHDRD